MIIIHAFLHRFGFLLCIAALATSAKAQPEDTSGLLAGLQKHHVLTTTVPENGDQNPYAVIVAPVSAGEVEQGDVLVGNFNNDRNFQGTGRTIVRYSPRTGEMNLFSEIPADLAGCPGGVGLSAAMVMLKSGWVIVGSAPGRDGTTATLGRGCLIVLDSKGKVAGVIAGKDIAAPWGNMAVDDRGGKATLFVSNAGFGVGAPAQDSPVVRKATVLRLELSIPPGRPPIVKQRTVVADGLGQQADKGVFLIGPTGLALAPDGTLYISDAVDNRIVAVEHAVKRKASAGQGRTVTQGGLLRRPLALALTPQGSLIATNAQNGQAVEIDPASGEQIGAHWLNANKAQRPPGSGNLFGLALTPDGKGIYYVQDDMNTLALAQ